MSKTQSLSWDNLRFSGEESANEYYIVLQDRAISHCCIPDA